MEIAAKLGDVRIGLPEGEMVVAPVPARYNVLVEYAERQSDAQQLPCAARFDHTELHAKRGPLLLIARHPGGFVGPVEPAQAQLQDGVGRRFEYLHSALTEVCNSAPRVDRRLIL